MLCPWRCPCHLLLARAGGDGVVVLLGRKFNAAGEDAAFGKVSSQIPAMLHHVLHCRLFRIRLEVGRVVRVFELSVGNVEMQSVAQQAKIG